MEIVKKNIVSIICGVVALAAVVVAVTMVSSRAAQLQADVEARKQVHSTLDGMLKKERTLPTVDPDNPTADKLTKFPSPSVIEQGEAITKAVEAESVAMREAAVAMNKHEPLVPGSIPAPPMGSPAQFNFRNRYAAFYPPQTASPLTGQFAKDLQAGIPPTPEEVTLRQAERAADIRAKRLRTVNGQPVNQPQVDAEIAETARKLPLELREQAANNSKVYINRETFLPYAPILAAAGAPDPVDIYLAQISLWIQQDVVAAVKEANASARNIKDAPVKHLINVFTPPNFIFPAAGVPTNDADGALPKEAPVSPTGRVCNGLYDVFHFDLNADVEAARLAEFLRVLGRNRFITPLWVNVRAVDNATELAAGRVYGNNPVVNCNIRCEILYLRKWNAPLMPQRIKDKLAIPAEVPAGEQPAAPAQPSAAAHP
ncbi:MAG TPA: hypothetical protein VER17_07695 [Tepidisphaeraceae bacterium]|nr:hypothetical protein [Tepidisphaeraceae bacterium]